ncbi:hypothetical protein ACFV06_19420 [Streptomyces sp. NPDC059618]|uniref:hypothetical protein n=1 Tax=Streptomyces sp. NPDC059618 TaxID=3346887 RepID=UPI00368566B5
MTAGAREPLARSGRASGAEYGDAAGRWAAPPGCVITADGAYGARLAHDGERWYPERWTLDGPEPYAVPLPGPQPEEPGNEVLPLSDGRVLIHRVDDGRHTFSLLYPTGPGTGELPLGAVECPDAGTVLRLLPPAPDGERAYALAVGRGSTAVWLVAGGAFGPEHLAEVPGHCSGGVWLDGTGRLLALDRSLDGRTKTVVVDLERGGEVSPLLQIAEHSNDRLLLADADSGLLLIRSDAPSPGRDRLGWGVLGSTLPVRFPDCLSATGCSISPFAIQPGQVLTPESCAVALRLDGPGGTWVGVWRPSERRIHHRPAPEGWLPGTGLWTAEGVLRLPYVTGGVPCGVARLEAPEGPEDPDAGVPSLPGLPAPRPLPLQQAPLRTAPPAVAPRRIAAIDPPRAIPAHLALSDGIARARKEAATRATDDRAPWQTAPARPVPEPDASRTAAAHPAAGPGAPGSGAAQAVDAPGAPQPGAARAVDWPGALQAGAPHPVAGPGSPQPGTPHAVDGPGAPYAGAAHAAEAAEAQQPGTPFVVNGPRAPQAGTARGIRAAGSPQTGAGPAVAPQPGTPHALDGPGAPHAGAAHAAEPAGAQQPGTPFAVDGPGAPQAGTARGIQAARSPQTGADPAVAPQAGTVRGIRAAGSPQTGAGTAVGPQPGTSGAVDGPGAPRTSAARAAEAAGAPWPGAGPVSEGPETLSAVTGLTPRALPAGTPGADGPYPGHGTGEPLPPVVRLAAGGNAEPLPPAVGRAPEATGPVRPSRWTRVTQQPAPMTSTPRTSVSMAAPTPVTSVSTAPVPAPPRRAAAPTTEPGLWTKVAETPPPGMGLRTRADGTLPGGMTVVVETAEPVPPATSVGSGPVTGAGAPAAPAPDAGGHAPAAPVTAPAPAPPEPLLWTKVAETPPPGMSLGARTRPKPVDGDAPGSGTSDTPSSVGAFRGQVILRPLPTAPQASLESGGPCVLAHTDEEKRDRTGEETSPSDSRAMTAR